ncbi:MAG: HAMP domain-containing sensor histidine kinase, partial [Pseudomonadota bacterium]
TALADAVPGAVERRAIDGRSYDVFAPDIAVESESWDLPMAEVFVSYAVGVPTLQTRSARREVLAVWAGYALAVAVGVALHLDHRRRYRTGLDRINAVLDDFAAGNTSATVAIDTEAPELRRLSDHLSDVLPRFDQLLSDLRALTAHLAHELKTPLQTIRSDVRRLSVAGEVDARRGIAREIDGTIDATDGRLRSVMQLFRLSADVQVALNEGVAFGELITDQVYDFEDRLVDRGRALVVNVAEGIEVTANAPLLELLVANLLSNAVKYAPEQSRIGIDLVHEGDRFKFRVWNTGSAFPEDWMNRPFQRLSRAEAHSDIPGHGLGLALVDVIARRHGFLARTVNGTDPDTGAPLAAVTVQGPCRTFG